VGHDPGVSALVMSARAHWALGQPGRARCVADETSSWRETTACPLVGTCPDLHLRSSNRALGHTGGEGSRVQTGELSDEQGLARAQASGLLFFGWTRALSGDVGADITRLEEGLSI